MLRIRRFKGKNYKVVWHSRAIALYSNLPKLTLYTIAIGIVVAATLHFKSTVFVVNISDDNTHKTTITELLHTYDITTAKKMINNLNSVKEVKMKRIWNKIYVNISTNTPVYAYYDNDEFMGYINDKGQWYIAPQSTEDFIRISAPEHHIKRSFERLNEYQVILSQSNKIKVARYVTTPVEQLILQNGAKIIIGHIDRILRLKKMMNAINTIKFRENSIVDLRYKNGFAKTN